ncbi:MAG: hypothetical protein JWP36_2690 [Paucimonas sp.]|jgi:uncharacterized protein (DUF433 family)|nr:hypothetical protein [Paucimonas sp.]
MAEVGIGMYTLADAAQLIHGDRRAIRRWLYGYDYTQRKGEASVTRHSPPLWIPQYAEDEFDEKVIGFHDLLELRIVKEFVQSGVPLRVVRHCMDVARQIFGVEYPFTHRRFATDGETIFSEAVRSGDAEDEGMLNLRTRQYAFREIIKDSLYLGIEYDDGYARRWYPEKRSKAVVVDPERQFGHPVLEESGVPTASIYATFLAESRDRAAVAHLFDIPASQVTAAVRFEEKLRAVA